MKIFHTIKFSILLTDTLLPPQILSAFRSMSAKAPKKAKDPGDHKFWSKQVRYFCQIVLL